MACHIKISDGKTSVKLPVTHNKLPLATLKIYFPEATSLIYKLDGESIGVSIEKDSIILENTVESYEVFYPPSEKKSNTFQDEKSNRARTILNLLKSDEEENTWKPMDEFQILNIGWKHKSSKNSKYVLMKRPMAEPQKIELNKSRNYSYEEIKNLAIEAMQNDENEEILSNSVVKLGLYDNTIFNDFTDSKGNLLNFWVFAKQKFKNSTRQLKLYILSEKQEDRKESKQYENHQTLLKRKLDSTDTENDLKVSSWNNESIHEALTYKQKKSTNLEMTSTEKNLSWSCLFKQHNISAKLVDKEDVTLLSSELGRGGYGTVNAGLWLNTSVAIKKIKMKDDPKYILREVSTLDKIRHQNIISLMAVTFDAFDFYLIMENFVSNTLRVIIFDSVVKRQFDLTYDKKISIARQICTAISFLHDSSPSIIHKDIKPENILVNMHCLTKLCDFGLSRSDDMDSSLNTTAGSNPKGTVLYMAPEVLLNNSEVTSKSDVWSLACVITEIFTEQSVWRINTEDLMLGLSCVLKQNMKKKMKPNISDVPMDIRKVISSCLDYNCARRPKASTVLDILNCYDSDEEI